MPVLPAVPSTMVPPEPQHAAFLGVGDDEQAGAILHRSAGVHELGLAQYGAAGRLGGAAQPDQRRVADRSRQVFLPGRAVIQGGHPNLMSGGAKRNHGRECLARKDLGSSEGRSQRAVGGRAHRRGVEFRWRAGPRRGWASRRCCCRGRFIPRCSAMPRSRRNWRRPASRRSTTSTSCAAAACAASPRPRRRGRPVFPHVYNVADGFEGPPDGGRAHRGRWPARAGRPSGLPVAAEVYALRMDVACIVSVRSADDRSRAEQVTSTTDAQMNAVDDRRIAENPGWFSS